MGAERRQYLRVLFEETIEIRTKEWTDPVATGLDVSLNGVRFHCEHPLSDGELVTIGFRPDFEISGKVRWCWPIEWYYQSAVQFIEITPEEQEQLRQYIIEVSGEDYPDAFEKEGAETTAAAPEPTQTESSLDLEDEDDWLVDLSEDDLNAATDEDEFISLDEDEALDDKGANGASLDTEDQGGIPSLNVAGMDPRSFEGRSVVILGENQEHSGLLKEYLTGRTGFEVEAVSKKQNLWRLMKIDPVDMVIMEWQGHTGEESLGTLRQTRDAFPSVPVICLAGPVSLEHRLSGLNAGASDFLTRPVHLSSVAQSVLTRFNSDGDPATDAMAAAVASDPVSAAADPGLLEDDLDMSEELELIEDDF
ncbi:MAG: PilZ domain-containing protein [SAR324 cluster bacterium]|nr:PilZ domain-containing protein [SAR324 cluster bacterium]